MRRKYYATRATVRTALLDATIAAISVLLAIAIRANFRDFLVEVAGVALLGPFIVLTRAGTMAFFEHYSYSRSVWQTRDVAALFLHNLIPTSILTVLRFASPLRALRFPASVILLEYVISVMLMILLRLADQKVNAATNDVAVYRPRVAVYGEVQDLRQGEIISNLQEKSAVIVRAILSPNPLHWDTDLSGIRVVGDEHSLPELLRADDTISEVLIANPDLLPTARRRELERQAALCRVTVTDLVNQEHPGVGR